MVDSRVSRFSGVCNGGEPHGGKMIHLKSETPSPQMPRLFTEDGKWAKGELILEFSCLKCHLDRDMAWATQYAKNAHTIGK